MKKIILILPLLMATFFSKAQAPAIEWQRSYGGSDNDLVDRAGKYVVQTLDGGFITIAYTLSSDGDVTSNYGISDYWVVKLDNIGNIQWQKSFGGSSVEEPRSIQQTSDSGYIIAGYSRSDDGDVSGGHGSSDVWVIKLDKNGTLQWQKALGGSGNDGASSVQQTSDGGYIVAGYSESNDGDVSVNHGFSDEWIIKLNGSGIIQWQKSLGGSGTDQANSIRQTGDGGYIVAGISSSTDFDITGNIGGFDYWVLKLDGNGTVQWQKSLGGTGNDFANSIQLTNDGGYIIAGYSGSNDIDVSGNNGADDEWIVKLKSSGDILWQKSLGGSGTDRAYYVSLTAEGGYIIAGWTSSNDGDVNGNNGSEDEWVTKLSSDGNLQWQKSLGGTDKDDAFTVDQTSDGGYIVAGNSQSNDGDVTGNHGEFDAWLVKLEGCKATITGSLEICSGASTQLGGSGAAALYTPWLSSVPAVAIINNSGVVTGVSAGTSEITYINTEGCFAKAVVTINPLPTAIITPDGPTTFCQGGSVQLSAGTPGNNQTYLWSLGGATTPSITVTATGNYTVTVTSVFGCSKISAAVKVTVNPCSHITCPGNITVKNDQGKCGAKVNYHVATTPKCGNLIYSKAPGSFFPVGTTLVTVKDPSTGETCSFTITVKDCEKPTITPPANVTINTNYTGCAATGVSLGKAVTKDNCAVKCVNNNAPSVFPSGATTVKWTVEDIHGNTATVTQTVTVTSSLKLVLSAGNISCNGSTTTLKATASGGTGYSYSLNGSSFKTSNTFTVKAATYCVTVKDSRGCITSKYITINQPSVLTPGIYSKTNVSCSGGKNGSIKVKASGGKAPYKYKLNNGSYGSGSTFSSLKAGTYTVYVKDANDCTKCISVSIKDGTGHCNSIAVQQSTQRRGSDANIITEIMLAATVFPNPSATEFSLMVKGSNTAPVEISVIDILGRYVHKTKGSANQIYKFGQRFIPGVYIVQILQGELVKTIKVVKN